VERGRVSPPVAAQPAPQGLKAAGPGAASLARLAWGALRAPGEAGVGLGLSAFPACHAGLGLAEKTNSADVPCRCALPTTAFLEIPMRRPISAVESPSAQKARSRSIASCVQSMKEPPFDLPNTIYGREKRWDTQPLCRAGSQKSVENTPSSLVRRVNEASDGVWR